MIVAINDKEILLPRYVPRANGTPISIEIGSMVFVETIENGIGRDILLVPINPYSQNFFIKQSIDAYGEVNTRTIVITKEGINEVFGRDQERECRFTKWDDDQKWFYVRGDVDDDDIEKFFTVGLLVESSMEKIVETAHRNLPNFNKNHYQVADREKLIALLNVTKDK